MRKIDRRIVIVVSIIFIIGLAYGIMRFLEAQKVAPPQRMSLEARRYVKFEAVRYHEIQAEVSGPGRLSSVSEVEIIAEAAGKIQAGDVALKKGSTFNKGQVLFRVYPDEAKLSLKARKSQYMNTLAGIIPDLKVDFPESVDAFMDFFSFISVDRPLPLLPNIQNEQLEIFLSSRSVISEYYNIQKDQLQLQRRIVRAPFNGTYKEVYLEAGAYTNMGGRVAYALRSDQLELEVPLKRSDAAWVNIEDPVVIYSENRDLNWKGKVIRKSQYVDEGTQSQEIFINITSMDGQRLLPGEYLEASFPVRPIEGAMEIPRNAVFNSDEVFVIKNGRLSKRVIQVIKTNDRTLLFRGIPKGDSIVVQQLINVSEGTQVQTRNEKQGPPKKGRVPEASAAEKKNTQKKSKGHS